MAEERQMKKRKCPEAERYYVEDSTGETEEKWKSDAASAGLSQRRFEEGRGRDPSTQEIEDIIEDARMRVEVQGRSQPSSRSWLGLVQETVADQLSRLGPNFSVGQMGELLYFKNRFLTQVLTSILLTVVLITKGMKSKLLVP